MTKITSVGTTTEPKTVVTNIRSNSDGKGFTFDREMLHLVNNIMIFYDTATAYILGNRSNGNHSVETSGLTPSGSASSGSVSISGFASSTHHHTGSMYGTAQVDITTGSGTASVSGGVGGPIG